MKDSINVDAAAIVCAHVAKSNLPILLAAKDEPTTPEDSGWQFLCNLSESENMEDAQVWSLGEVLELEPSLTVFMDCPAGTEMIRDSQTSAWKSVGEADCQGDH